MLILPDGSRVGAVSGGCLEGELCKRAHWWTSQSPALRKTFDTSAQEDNEGFGLGCGGGIDLLLERLEPEATANPETHPLLALEQVHRTREKTAIAVVVEPSRGSNLQAGHRFALNGRVAPGGIERLMRRGLGQGYSFPGELHDADDAGTQVFVDVLVPPVQLVVCGAGTDALPVVALANGLGWNTVVLDQRADMARARRFSQATAVIVARHEAALKPVRLDARTAAIVMSHSFAQDAFFLEWLLPCPLRYLGVLGSRRRTLDLLARLGQDTLPEMLHAPAGLDIGAETPEQIALSILGEVQARFAERSGGALRDRTGSIHGRELLFGGSPEDETRVTIIRDCPLT